MDRTRLWGLPGELSLFFPSGTGILSRTLFFYGSQENHLFFLISCPVTIFLPGFAMPQLYKAGARRHPAGS